MIATPDGDNLLLLDRFGDVYAFNVKSDLMATEPSGGKKEDDDEEEVGGDVHGPVGKLILGHVSMLTCAYMPNNHTIITGDRDEHIRVSKYPDGHNIVGYCLGHQQFITSLDIPSFSPDTLISASGDSFVLLWDWKLGKPIQKIELPIHEQVAVTRISSHAGTKTVGIAYESTLLLLKPTDARGRLAITETIQMSRKIADFAFDTTGRLIVLQPDGVHLYNGTTRITEDKFLDAVKSLEPFIVDKRDSFPLENLRKGTNFGKPSETKFFRKDSSERKQNKQKRKKPSKDSPQKRQKNVAQ
jgi:WD40 repeat protein